MLEEPLPEKVGALNKGYCSSCSHDIIDFDSNKDVHYFPIVILGLIRDRDLILRPHPTRNPIGYSMLNFTRFLRHTYGLKRDRPLILGEAQGSS
jgi:hypothetical protein